VISSVRSRSDAYCARTPSNVLANAPIRFTISISVLTMSYPWLIGSSTTPTDTILKRRMRISFRFFPRSVCIGALLPFDAI